MVIASCPKPVIAGSRPGGQTPVVTRDSDANRAAKVLRHLARTGLLVVLAAATASGSGPGTSTATFAGGCFWCMEEPFEKLDGVISVTAGYTGGSTESPTHETVSAGAAGHVESVEIVFDPSRIAYRRLLEVFWHNIDPLTPGGQFCDRGRQYRTAIFFHDDDQRRVAEDSRRRVEETLHAPVVTELAPAVAFHAAEKYHQDFYRKNPVEYHRYRSKCGRDARLRELWGKGAGGAEAAVSGSSPRPDAAP